MNHDLDSGVIATQNEHQEANHGRVSHEKTTRARVRGSHGVEAHSETLLLVWGLPSTCWPSASRGLSQERLIYQQTLTRESRDGRFSATIYWMGGRKTRREGKWVEGRADGMMGGWMD